MSFESHRRYFDPQEEYDFGRVPPAAFVADLESLDANLCVAWHRDSACWMLAEVIDYPVCEFSDLLDARGNAIETSRVMKRVAVEFGEERVLDPSVIARIKRFSKRFGADCKQDDYDAAMAMQQAAYVAFKDAQGGRAEFMQAPLAALGDDFGRPLASVESEGAAMEAGAKLLKSERDSFFRQILTPEGKRETRAA